MPTKEPLVALTDIISIAVQDYTGGRKTIPLFVPSGSSVAALQALSDVSAALIDLAIDSKIVGSQVTVQLSLPGGLKGSPIVGNTVREGALIDYSVTGSIYRWGTYYPSWKNTGFTGNVVDNTGAFANVITDLGQYVDKNGDALNAYIEGTRRFRK